MHSHVGAVSAATQQGVWVSLVQVLATYSWKAALRETPFTVAFTTEGRQ